MSNVENLHVVVIETIFQNWLNAFLLLNGFWNIMETDSEILCDFNFVDISKFKDSNDNNRINDVPPAIHFRISMEYWMFVANPNKFENEYVNITY